MNSFNLCPRPPVYCGPTIEATIARPIDNSTFTDTEPIDVVKKRKRRKRRKRGKSQGKQHPVVAPDTDTPAVECGTISFLSTLTSPIPTDQSQGRQVSTRGRSQIGPGRQSGWQPTQTEKDKNHWRASIGAWIGGEVVGCVG
eukprot:m.165596 g.165596  ORF g.165596 m.165596 type:complete len:142 (+) comp24979_c2_seq3:2687-3112(+)